MHVKKAEQYIINRFLYLKHGMVFLDSKNSVNPLVSLPDVIVKKHLRSLESKEIITIMGNWSRLWCFVTQKGREYLKDAVGLPSEEDKLEQAEIKY